MQHLPTTAKHIRQLSDVSAKLIKATEILSEYKNLFDNVEFEKHQKELVELSKYLEVVCKMIREFQLEMDEQDRLIAESIRKP